MSDPQHAPATKTDFDLIEARINANLTRALLIQPVVLRIP